MSRPGGGSGNGHRASFGIRPPVFGFRRSGTGLRFRRRAYGLGSPDACAFSGLRRAPSHLWLGTGPPGLHYCIYCLLFRPIPVRRKLCAWDCKVTPASCACQEGNTIGCIPSNDGLDAGSRPCFPHHRKRRRCDLLRRRQYSLFGTQSGSRGWGCCQRKQESRFSCRARFTWASSHQAHVLGRAPAIAKGLWQFPANGSWADV